MINYRGIEIEENVLEIMKKILSVEYKDKVIFPYVEGKTVYEQIMEEAVMV